METTKTGTSSNGVTGKKSPKLSDTRTNRDWVMIALGILLIVFFIVAGYVSIIKTKKNSPLRKQGPVKRPAKQGSIFRNHDIRHNCKTIKHLEILRDYGIAVRRNSRAG